MDAKKRGSEHSIALFGFIREIAARFLRSWPCIYSLTRLNAVLALARYVFHIDHSHSAGKAGPSRMGPRAWRADVWLDCLNGALSSYQQAVLQYQMRTEAIDRLSDMEAAFNRYLLDGNSANTGLIQADKQRIDQLAQANADAQNDKLLQSLVASEQKWYGQAVQPLLDARRNLAAGQGLPEDFLAKYRAAPQDLQIINFEISAENAYHEAQQALQQAEDQLRWR